MAYEKVSRCWCEGECVGQEKLPKDEFCALDYARAFTLAVKDPSGEWTTISAIEVLMTQPIKVNTSVPGLVQITAGTTDTPEAAVPAEPA